MKYKKVVIGIDQSYQDTGITIIADNQYKHIKSIKLRKLKNNSERRLKLNQTLEKIMQSVANESEEIICVIERIRLHSNKFINIDYIKSIGALNSIIVDVCNFYNVPVYSVDTRAWKAAVVGTSKPLINKLGIPPEKYPTINWCINEGLFENVVEIAPERKQKTAYYDKETDRYLLFNDNIADSIAIAKFGFIGKKDKLKLEK